MRRTRILATLGPASRGPATIRALLDAGADAFRLNFSHGTIDEHARTLADVRAISSAAGRHIPVMQDLGGPKIRTGPLHASLTLNDGDALTIDHGTFEGEAGRVACAFDALFTSLQPGNRLLVDDGRIELEVTGVSPGRLTTRVLNGGALGANKEINVPNVPLRTPALTPKDLDDLRGGLAMGVDLVALSFVQSADDVMAARAVTAAAGQADLPLIAKIEKPQAVAHLDEIIRAADGVIVARGDLGIEMPLETVPAVQRQVVRAARRRGVPVIVATQVLESMMSEPRPTRAEVTDAAHAVDEGADAILLTGETAAGQYPVKTVSTLNAIVAEAERMIDPTVRLVPEADGWSEHGRALCEAAVTLAQSARASAIVAVTQAGKTARLLAALRPDAAILAAAPNAQAAARLGIVWGVTPFVTDASTIPAVRDRLLMAGLVAPGAVVVFVSMRPMLGQDDTNFVHVERI